jgi:hypothetical protein
MGMILHAGSTSVIMFAEEDSLRGQAVNFAKIQHKSHYQNFLEDGRSKQLVTNDTSSHVYIKTNLKVSSYCPMWIAMRPEMGDSGTDSINKKNISWC